LPRWSVAPISRQTASSRNSAGSSRRARRGPEPRERHAAALAVLGEQQRGDQVAADHEEHVDAEEAAWHPGDAGVVEEDRGDRHGAQTVDAGHPAKPGRRRARLSWSGGRHPAKLCAAFAKGARKNP